jgi:hypothetical protein
MSRQTNTLQVSQKGPYIREVCPQGIFISLKKNLSFRFPGKGALHEVPSTEPLDRAIPHPQSSFIQLSKSRQARLHVPQKRSPYEGGYLFPEPSLTEKG